LQFQNFQRIVPRKQQHGNTYGTLWTLKQYRGQEQRSSFYAHLFSGSPALLVGQKRQSLPLSNLVLVSRTGAEKQRRPRSSGLCWGGGGRRFEI
jgi:hypothetical protein